MLSIKIMLLEYIFIEKYFQLYPVSNTSNPIIGSKLFRVILMGSPIKIISSYPTAEYISFDVRLIKIFMKLPYHETPF